MHRVTRSFRQLRSTIPSAGVGFLLALGSLPVVAGVAAAATASTNGSPLLSRTAPPGGRVGPSSSLDWMIWTIANHTGVARSATFELTFSRPWPAHPTSGIPVPANDSVAFLVPISVPDTAAAGDVSVFARVSFADDGTPLD